MRIGIRALVVAGLALVGPLVTATPALAHNSLTGSDPEDGASVEHAPGQVQLTFLAAVDPDNAEFDVTGPDGSSVMAEDAEVDEKTVMLPIEPGPAGDYEVVWRVLASDGDWVDGTVGFTVTVGVLPSLPPDVITIPATPPTLAAYADPAAGRTGGGGSGPAWWVWALVALLAVAAVGYGGYRLRRRSAG